MSATATPSRRPSSPASRLANRAPAPRSGPQPSPSPAPADGAAGSEAPILFQDYFKLAGPRTYAAQVKRARNDNHFIVLTEGKRDDKTGEVRKTKLLVFSEDFEAFFRMVSQVSAFVRDNPVPTQVAERQRKRWESKGSNRSDRKG